MAFRWAHETDQTVVVEEKAAVNYPIGNLTWTDETTWGDQTPPYLLPPWWPRCAACNLTNNTDITPALAVDPRGVALCDTHILTSGYSHPSMTPLEPPCAMCANPCDPAAHPWVVNDRPSPKRGYLCGPCGRQTDDNN